MFRNRFTKEIADSILETLNQISLKLIELEERILKLEEDDNKSE